MVWDVLPKLTDGWSKMTVELIWIMDHSISHQLGKVGNFNFKPLLLVKAKKGNNLKCDSKMAQL